MIIKLNLIPQILFMNTNSIKRPQLMTMMRMKKNQSLNNTMMIIDF